MIPCSWDVVVPDEVCSGWDDYPTTTKDTALWLASTWLWGATGRRYGVCPVTIRPAQNQVTPALYQDFPVATGDGLGVSGGPFLFGGRWFNAPCSSACCGGALCAVVLRGPVSSVDEVLVDGEVVPASAYRVDVTGGLYLLVRTDGTCWPVCQNFLAGTDEPGTFEVTYGYGLPLPEALAIATAMLACEYAQHLSGGRCALPAKMTRLSRQGVEIQVEPPAPGQGLTGIKAVDDVVTTLNPGRLQSPPVILSPDMPGGCDRRTIWAGGS